LFLNIDIDGYDYYVLDAILSTYRPHLITAEINENIPPPIKFSILYTKNGSWNGWSGKSSDHFFGMSISKLYDLCIKHSYDLINLNYNNAFLMPHETNIGGKI